MRPVRCGGGYEMFQPQFCTFGRRRFCFRTKKCCNSVSGKIKIVVCGGAQTSAVYCEAVTVGTCRFFKGPKISSFLSS